MNLEPLYAKILMCLPKVFAAIVGAILSLVLSNDIDKDGIIKLNRRLICRFALSVIVALFLGQSIIEYMGWEFYSPMFQGTVMLFSGLFGLLILGIFYQAIAMLRGKSFKEIVIEVKEAFFAIFGR